MNPTIYIVPRWSGSQHSDWYDWFGQEINKRIECRIVALTMPHWQAPDPEESTAYLMEQIPEVNESVFIIGHSVGCLAVLHFLNKKMTDDPSIRVGGILMVAGWFGVDESWPSVLPWLKNTHMSYPTLRENIHQKRVVISDNDPFTSDFTENAALWRDRLGAEVTICPAKAHFNSKIEPDVLSEFYSMMDKADLKMTG